MKANPKTVALYIGMIGFIVAAFSAIASYGSTHLRAPEAIGGQYVVRGLPGDCFSEPPLLVVGQSGSYLGADIVPADAKKNLLTRALKGNGLLHGQVESAKVHLAGRISLGTCKEKQPVTLEASVAGGRLQGQVALAGRTLAIEGETKKAE
ncbi:hypothetical protein [Gloeobacter kilaueensis]|uniref:Uncharacterized protein n=1 Tax=Gloeobacter kilaueensis (strain ATCC BAA-2537 / CCAP 1431/1 / ULC 316 / JS1) TaxID=1183438 RepID=U5QPF6_GLOK1|nr:hypothetical protein [Gloeobacter kilaueensis]AGY59484.1 hypothetical protein GKIL_3238 [Gloeobacter kilaueensis JS1]